MNIIVNIVPSPSPTIYPDQAKLVVQLGQRLRDARLRRRFPVSLVAARAGISRPTMNKVEQGDPSVTIGTYLRVLKVLGLERELEKVVEEDPVGRRLLDAEIGAGVPRRAPRRKPLPAAAG